MLFSCKEESKPETAAINTNPTTTTIITDTATPAPPNMKQWAEQVESSINLSVPEDWAPEDWNNVFRNIDHKSIYADVIDAVLSGKQTAFNFFTNAAFTLDQVKAILEKKVTVLNKDSLAKNAETRIIYENIGPNTISLMRVREKVWFDKDNFKLERKPTALILYVNHYSEDGTFVGYQPLFYVKLNN
ncbi:MAG: hypothetical protein JNL63_10630 [Bacteroidia bacterium]|nr:hypothetical protein [Bacteroidia bacterium]